MKIRQAPKFAMVGLLIGTACGDDGHGQPADQDQTEYCNEFEKIVLGQTVDESAVVCSCFGAQPTVADLDAICEDNEAVTCIDLQQGVYSNGACPADTGTGGELPPYASTGVLPDNDCPDGVILPDGTCCDPSYTDCCDGLVCSNYDFEDYTQRAPLSGAPYAASFGTGSSIELVFATGENWEDSASSGLSGSVQYAYTDCGKTECPFILYGASVDATSSMSIDIKIGATTKTKVISNLSIRLLYPVFGVHDTSTDDGWFSRRSLVWVIEFDLSGGQFGSENGHYARVTTSTNDLTTSNSPNSHTFTFDSVAFDLGSMVGIDLVANVTQNMSLTDSPPAANGSATRTCSTPGNASVVFSSTSTDPDNDIAYVVWRINGTLQGIGNTMTKTLANGSYKWALTAFDARGGFNTKYGAFVVSCP